MGHSNWSLVHPALSEPNPVLDDDRPIDRIAQGDYRSVTRLISSLEDPGAS